MIPLQGFVFEKDQGEHGKDQQGNDFLDDFQLYQRKRPAVFPVAQSVGGHHQAIFHKGDEPARQNQSQQPRLIKKLVVLEF